MLEQQKKRQIDIDILEFKKLKDEQVQRIGFRDNMVYVTMVAVGGVASFATSDVSHLFALLIIPWICFVLGWTYLVNDEKISAIGKYIRQKLSERIRLELDSPLSPAFNWETEHRSDPRRKQRKVIQFFVDFVTFCGSGIFAVIAFWIKSPSRSGYSIAMGCIELVLLILLTGQLFLYADFKRGRW